MRHRDSAVRRSGFGFIVRPYLGEAMHFTANQIRTL
jgi:hypothetical protein